MKLRLAILGTRGIPASYGGFETFAEELSTRLVKQGHEVTVYCRRGFFDNARKDNDYLGVKLCYAPTIYQKYLETPLHALSSFLMIKKRDVDCVLLCNAANSPFSWILKLKGIPFAVNVDGVERRRAKWNAVGRFWYLLGEKASIYFANRVVADAQVISDYYKERYSADTSIISYGAEARALPAGAVLSELGLNTGDYILYVSRLEPENNALGVIEAYVKSKLKIPLVIVGDAPYADAYKVKLRSLANDGVIFAGFRFGEAYRELRSNCKIYIQATEVGGTHPALVEAMAYGNAIIANDVPEHREVLQAAGLYYSLNDFDELSNLLKELVADDLKAKKLGHEAARICKENFSWERICDEYINLFEKLLN